MGEGWILGLSALFVLNVLAFAAFGWDKFRSLGDRRRTSERRLLAHAFWGGYPGAKLGQRFFNHKTRKEPFARRLNRIGAAQTAVALSAAAFMMLYGPAGRDAGEDAASMVSIAARILSF